MWYLFMVREIFRSCWGYQKSTLQALWPLQIKQSTQTSSRHRKSSHPKISSIYSHILIWLYAHICLCTKAVGIARSLTNTPFCFRCSSPQLWTLMNWFVSVWLQYLITNFLGTSHELPQWPWGGVVQRASAQQTGSEFPIGHQWWITYYPRPWNHS